jgi:PAS domain S-box-containing protein
MKRQAGLWGQVSQTLVGIALLTLVTAIGMRVQAGETTATLIALFVAALISLWVEMVPALIIALTAALTLDFFFTAPLFQFRVHEGHDLIAAITFAATALVITRLRGVARQSFEEVQALKNELELVVDTIPALTWRGRPDGSRDFVSRRWVEYTGVQAREGLGSGWIETLHPDDAARYLEHWRQAVATGEPLAVEARLRSADGRFEWFLIRAVPFRDARGDVTSWYGTSTNIEGQKHAERLLAGEKMLLELIARGVAVREVLDALCRFVEELSPDRLASVLLLDADGVRLRHGAAPSLSQSYIDAIDGQAIGADVGSCGSAAFRNATVIVSDVMTDPLWANFRELASAHSLRACWSTPIRASDGGVLGTFAMYARTPSTPSDAERALVEQVTHLAAIAIEQRRAGQLVEDQARLLDLTHDTVFVRDANDVITFWNRGAEELYGWTREEVVGKVTHDVLQTQFPVSLQEILAQLTATHRWEGELVHAARGGEVRIVASRWSLLTDEAGRPQRILETNNDISARRHAEDAARKAQDELAHAARLAAMGEMAASIAHEVNQPLSGVVINANACLRWLGGEIPNLEEARENLQRIVRDGKRASDVIARVRALSRKGAAERERLDINEAIRSVVVLVQGELRKHQVVYTLALGADPPYVTADRVQIQQVVLNLIMNAVEAMHGIVDRPRDLVIETRRDGAQVCVTVQDSGIGLGSETSEHLFEAFYTTKRSGLGMGLSISRTIVANHGGRLWAAPNEGPGATFQFTL